MIVWVMSDAAWTECRNTSTNINVVNYRNRDYNNQTITIIFTKQS